MKLLGDKNYFYGTGVSEKSDTLAAVDEAYQLSGLPEDLKPSFILIFSTGRHNPNILYNRLRELAGPDTKICGGYAVGLISNDYIGYDGYQLGMLVVYDPTVLFDVFWGEGIQSEPAVLSKKP